MLREYRPSSLLELGVFLRGHPIAPLLPGLVGRRAVLRRHRLPRLATSLGQLFQFFCRQGSSPRCHPFDQVDQLVGGQLHRLVEAAQNAEQPAPLPVAVASSPTRQVLAAVFMSSVFLGPHVG